MRNRCIHILLATAMVGCALTAHGQQFYKWVDDKGVTQYTTTPPPGGKAQAIKTAPASPPPGAKTWQEQEIEFRARQVERAEAEHKQEQAETKAKRDAALRRSACSSAHREVQALQEQRPVYILNEKGERQYLDDAQRTETLRKTKAFIEQECPK